MVNLTRSSSLVEARWGSDCSNQEQLSRNSSPAHDLLLNESWHAGGTLRKRSWGITETLRIWRPEFLEEIIYCTRVALFSTVKLVRLCFTASNLRTFSQPQSDRQHIILQYIRTGLCRSDSLENSCISSLLKVRIWEAGFDWIQLKIGTRFSNTVLSRNPWLWSQGHSYVILLMQMLRKLGQTLEDSTEVGDY